MMNNLNNFQYVTNRFYELENELKLLEDGNIIKPYWERIRFSLHQNICIKLGLDDRILINKNNIIGKFSIILNIIPNLVTIKSYLKKEKKYLFLTNPRRKLLRSGLYHDLFTDPLIELLNENSVCALEMPLKNRHYKPEYTNNLKYFDWYELIINLRAKLIKKTLSAEILKIISSIESVILDSFNLRLDIKSMIVKSRIRMKAAVPVYKKLLSKIKPEIIFLVCSYGKEDLIDAARELGIISIELQHGIIHKNHPGYNYPNSGKKSFPDYLLVFGDEWKKVCKFPTSETNIIPLGYPFFVETTAEININKNNSIIYLSQPNNAKKLHENFIKTAIMYKGKYDFILKLHPLQYKNRKTIYCELNEFEETGLIKVIDSDSPTLYELQSVAVFQVGVNSTALFEGTYFNSKTIILKLPGYENLEPFIDSGYFTFIEPDDIPDFDLLEKKEITKNVTFFEKNWKDNFANFLSNIITDIDINNKIC